MARRMNLLNIEKNIQNLWKEHNICEKEAGDMNDVRYTGNFPYPYMNGLLHIGHAFTLSKLEFSIRYKNMMCDNVLLPFSFHCTGTPIVVCADKLKNELKNKILDIKQTEKHECQLKDNLLEEKSGEKSGENGEKEEKVENVEKADATVFRSNKSKAQSKGSTQNTQYDIMKQMNISDDKIHLFQDPEYWCYYFSSQAKTHLEAFGLYCDWRRSFITTNINPYYNKFVNWQFNRLYKKNLIYYGSRITIFSRVNNQACADHERSEGEGVKCQEYTLIKIYLENYIDFFNIFIESVLNYNTEKSSVSNSVKYTSFNENEEYLKNEIWNENFFKTKKIIFLGSTLKPETAYGQNYTFMNPDDYYCVTFGFDKQMLNYGDKNYVNNIMSKDEIIKNCENIYICSENSLYNLAYQGIIPMLKKKEKKNQENNKTEIKNNYFNNIENDLFILAKIKGEKFVGLKIYTNISHIKNMYILPMSTIKMNISTGVVPCVSSDSIDDYACLEDIKKKKTYYCEKYNLLKEEYLNNESISCIELPGIGTHSGKHFYESEKITSHKDAKLPKLKGMLYKKQYFEGIMKIEPYYNMKTFNCRKIVKQNIIKNNQGFLYSEPEVLVIDRNNVKCIAALCNQWYINYGNLNFKKDVLIQLKKNKFQTYNDVLYKQLQHVIFWLDDWSCSRSYGLGTYMPNFNEKNKSENESIKTDENYVKKTDENYVKKTDENYVKKTDENYVKKTDENYVKKTDENYVKKTELIESLSDSTIYMAYYTISHYLQGNVDGKEKGILNIDHNDINDAFFDYVFDISNNTSNISKNISIDKLNIMRKSFKYWYPFDIRISGKDLIFNHLTMSLFNHVAIWGNKIYKKNKDCSEEKSALDKQTEILNEIEKLDLNEYETIKYFPKSFFCNGHVLINKEKMSKSKGNFITIENSINQYTSDGTRIALADAGDSIEDANFNTDTANSAIMKLYNLINFSIETKNNVYIFRCGEKTFNDLIFENEINYLTNKCKEAYEKLLFRDVLKYGFYDMLLKRDTYRMMCDKIHMHKETVNFFIERICIIINPIIPHVTEHIWTYILKKDKLLITQKWPSSENTNFSIVMHKQYNNLLNVMENFRKSYDKVLNKSNKSKGSVNSVNGVNSVNTGNSVNSVNSVNSGNSVNDNALGQGISISSGPDDEDEKHKFKAIVYVAREYNNTQKRIIEILNNIIKNSDDKKLPPNFINLLVQNNYVNNLPKNEKKDILSFATFLVKDNVTLNNNQYELTLPYDEIQLIKNNIDFIKRILNLRDIKILENIKKCDIDHTDIYKLANPGNPSIFIYNTKE